MLAYSETPPVYMLSMTSGKEIHFSDTGFVPQYAVPYGDLVEMSTCALMKGPFDRLELVSPVYCISETPESVFKKELKSFLDNWARLEEDTKLLTLFNTLSN